MSVSGFRYRQLAVAAMALAAPLLPSSAQAIPAFARQTEQPCAACHIGSFGPQLTDFGRDFKLNGYVWGKAEVKPWEHLSAMLYGGLEHYGKGIDNSGSNGPRNAVGPLSTYNSNDNLSLDQVSLFYGGRIYENIGAFAQITYKDSQRSFGWDNTDIRYADTGNIGDHLILYGVTINNNPMVQDVWQTSPAWIFPYVTPTNLGSGLTPPTMPAIWGAFAQSSIGAGVYAEIDDAFYFEVANYTGLSQRMQQVGGILGSDTADRLQGSNPYWRFTYDTHDGEQTFEVGTYGMDFHYWPGNFRNAGSDRRTDYAVDVNYQRFIDDNKHIVSLYATAIHEDADLNSEFGTGGANSRHLTLNTLSANASYYYDNTYGVSVGRTITTGSRDTQIYASNSASHKPDSSAWTFQIDYTPFGKDESYGAPYLNLRLFAQYTLFDKYNGGTSNYDGNGANAGDNNTFFTGVWVAF